MPDVLSGMSLFAELADVMSGMSPDQVVKVCHQYSSLLNGLGAKPFKDRDSKTREGQLNHLRYMCDHTVIEIQSAQDTHGVEKAMRWLGFIQGGMWALELRTIDEMRADNTAP